MAKTTLDSLIKGAYYNETEVNGIYLNGQLVWVKGAV